MPWISRRASRQCLSAHLPGVFGVGPLRSSETDVAVWVSLPVPFLSFCLSVFLSLYLLLSYLCSLPFPCFSFLFLLLVFPLSLSLLLYNIEHCHILSVLRQKGRAANTYLLRMDKTTGAAHVAKRAQTRNPFGAQFRKTTYMQPSGPTVLGTLAFCEYLLLFTFWVP